MEASVEVCIDVGGSGCKISAKKESDLQLTPFVKFTREQLFSSKKQYGKRVSAAIVDVLKRHSLPLSVSIVAISQSGNIDHDENMLILSYGLEQEQSTGNPYGQFNIAKEIQKGMKALINCTPKVVLLNDSISGCLDPKFEHRLVLTLTLGTYPVIGLSQKHSNYTKVYYSMIKNWVDHIIMSDGWQITESLKNNDMEKRKEHQNCKLIVEAMIKILAHYKEIFKWQPECFVVMGGNARFLKQNKEFPKEISHVKIVVLHDHQEAAHSQMRGALNYAKKKKSIRIQ